MAKWKTIHNAYYLFVPRQLLEAALDRLFLCIYIYFLFKALNSTYNNDNTDTVNRNVAEIESVSSHKLLVTSPKFEICTIDFSPQIFFEVDTVME